jgi:RNA polymerase sigma factor (sigma-70 family)
VRTMERDPQLRVRSFEQLYREEYRGVVAFSLALLGDRQAAEDVAQEAFIETHQHWDRIQNYDSPGAWVRRVASNKAVSIRRRVGAELRALTKLVGGLVQTAELAPYDHEFWNQVRKLPTKQAQAISLFYLEDRPVTELAEILGCTESTAKVHLHRGRAALAKALQLGEVV